MLSGKKKNQPKRKLSPIQQQRLIRISVVLVVCALLWIIFAPGAGVVALWSRYNTLDRIEQENIELDKKNSAIHSDINRLQSDPQYLEKVAREKYDMVKDGEQIYVMPGAGKKNKE